MHLPSPQPSPIRWERENRAPRDCGSNRFGNCKRWVWLFPLPSGICLARSAAVLGSSNVSTPNTAERYQVSPAPNPAAPEDGRTPLNTYPVGRERVNLFELPLSAMKSVTAAFAD